MWGATAGRWCRYSCKAWCVEVDCGVKENCKGGCEAERSWVGWITDNGARGARCDRKCWVQRVGVHGLSVARVMPWTGIADDRSVLEQIKNRAVLWCDA